MTPAPATDIDREAIDAFLESQSTGTLSFAKENDSYAIPVGFTYEPESGRFYFRLGYGPGSRKWEYARATERATFVVAADTEEGWRSVVARGTLTHINTVEDLAEHSLTYESVDQTDREARIPFYDVFETPSELLFALACLTPEEISGVTETSDGD
jgi:hypothetical protein